MCSSQLLASPSPSNAFPDFVEKFRGVVVVGGGVAGLFTALQLAPCPVLLLTAGQLGMDAASAWAQGGIAAAVLEGDHPDLHFEDTMEAGCHVNDPAAVRVLVDEAPQRIRDLLSYGVPFDRDLEGVLTASLEAAHSRPRVLHVKGDMAGRAILDSLIAAVRQSAHIQVVEHVVLHDLEALVPPSPHNLRGVFSFEGQERVFHLDLSHMVLSTGGLAALFDVSTNPPLSVGGGMQAAIRAGAQARDLSFVQFHPTALDVAAFSASPLPSQPAPLLTEALRGDGASLVHRDGTRFMAAYHPLGDLAPRDIVARAVYSERHLGRQPYLDTRHYDPTAFSVKYPTVSAALSRYGLKGGVDLIPVAPAAHYTMGGIVCDLVGASCVPGLWVVGEASSTGVHGANRLASNALLEGVVFGGRAAQTLKTLFSDAPQCFPSLQLTTSQSQSVLHYRTPDDVMTDIGRILGDAFGVVRQRDDMQRALAELEDLARICSARSLHSSELGLAIALAQDALSQPRSVGAHFVQQDASPAPFLLRSSG